MKKLVALVATNQGVVIATAIFMMIGGAIGYGSLGPVGVLLCLAPPALFLLVGKAMPICARMERWGNKKLDE